MARRQRPAPSPGLPGSPADVGALDRGRSQRDSNSPGHLDLATSDSSPSSGNHDFDVTETLRGAMLLSKSEQPEGRVG